MLKPWQERVRVEAEELRQKLDNLKRFIDEAVPPSEIPTVRFSDLSDDERKRLTEQRDLMQKYLQILEDRIANFK